MKNTQFVSSLTSVVVFCSNAWAQGPRTITEFARITASDGLPEDAFGFSLATYGDSLVVGAPGYITELGPSVGAVYVYCRSGSTWDEFGPFFADDGFRHANFGWSVAVEGELIVVGAPHLVPGLAGGGYGAAYILERWHANTPDDPSDDLWLQEAKLTSPDQLRFGDLYGYAVAISNGVVLIGRPGSENSSGSAYLYRRINGIWRYWATLDPSDPVIDDAFGSAVALEGSIALVGAQRRSDVGIHSGAVYAFQESQGSWSQVQKLIPSDAGDFGAFGRDVDFSGGLAVVGAGRRAYTLTKESNLWSEGAILRPSFCGLDFGISVSLSAESILVGDPSCDENSKDGYFNDYGAGHLFEVHEGVWSTTARLAAESPVPSTHLGYEIAMDAERAFAAGGGSVFVFILPNASQSLLDFSSFQQCFGTVSEPAAGNCGRFDLVVDGQVDSHDLTEFLAVFAGP